MKSKSVMGARLAVGLAASVALVGCYASEKIGKDIHDVSHDVNQGGIYMHHGALTVYRPEHHPSPALTNASITAPATAPAATAITADAAPAPTPEWQPPADGSEDLPKKEAAPPAAAPASAPDGGVYSM